MTDPPAQLNLVLGWLWILLGGVFGMVLGSFFHREDWLQGYGSFRRRLYRLAHVSFFGLAFLNILFFFTLRDLPAPTPWIGVASWGFAVAAVTMPACCVLMAHWPRLRPLFAIPVVGVLVGAFLMLREIWPR